MSNKNSKEYKIIASLFESGKITAEQRDELLAALDDGDKSAADTDSCKVVFRVYGMENPVDASRITKAIAELDGVAVAHADVKNGAVTVEGSFDSDEVLEAIKSNGFKAKPVSVDVQKGDVTVEGSIGSGKIHVKSLDYELDELEDEFDSIEEEFDEFDEEDEFDELDEFDDDDDDDDDDPSVNVHITDKKSLGGFLSGLGEKISAIVKKAGAKAGDIEKQVERQLKESLGGLYGDSDEDDDDIPYEKMVVRIEYQGSGRIAEHKCKVANIDGVIKSCEGVMSDECLGIVKKLLADKFKGKYSHCGSGEALEITVKPR